MIATVLLVVFAAAIAVSLVTWGDIYTAKSTEKADQASQTALDCATQGIEILRVFSDTSLVSHSSRTITRVDVRSVGQTASGIRDVLIMSTTSDKCNFVASDTVIQPAAITSFTGNCSVTCGNVDFIRVAAVCSDIEDVLVGNKSIVGCS